VLRPTNALRLIRSAHTAAWAVFAGSILAIPVLAWLRLWPAASVLIALVLVECAVLLCNGMRCPLTAVAARYTDDRRDNFDIYLPVWLARHNRLIFGWLFAAGLLFTLALRLA
jgi:polyferredoxin